MSNNLSKFTMLNCKVNHITNTDFSQVGQQNNFLLLINIIINVIIINIIQTF